MTIRLPDRWIWDSWYVWDGDVCHAFYLTASRGLIDPNRRHRNTNVGHAVSKDLVNWEILPDAISPSDSNAFDSWTTWTGSTVKGDDGRWWMFYTGTSREDGGDIQSIGVAHSNDLVNWTKASNQALLRADGRYYETYDKTVWNDEAWRDPWVFKLNPADELWHMLITARAKQGAPVSRGVVGHAVSKDMLNWEAQPPLSLPGSGFGQLEVLQFEVVDGVPVILFCCGYREFDKDRLALHGQNDGIFSLTCNPDLSGIDVSQAVQFPDVTLYAGRLVQNPAGKWFLLGFRNIVDGEFVGEICNPIPVTAVTGKGIVELTQRN